MLLSAVSVLVIAQSSSEIPEGLMNNPVFRILMLIALHGNSGYANAPHCYLIRTHFACIVIYGFTDEVFLAQTV